MHSLVPFTVANPPPEVRLGRIPDEPAEMYHKQPALSRSMLEDFAPPTGRPSYFYRKHVLRIPMDERRSKALDVGNAAETLILEGDHVYADRYAVLDKPSFGDQRNKDNKAAKQAWEDQHADVLKQIAEGRKIQISGKDHALNEQLRQSVNMNQIAGAILRCCEPQITWRVRTRDFDAQCRTDLYCDSVSEELAELIPGLAVGDAFFADLKTTESLDKGAFSSFWKHWQEFRYYRQIAFYRNVIQPIIKRPLKGGVLIAVEKTEPYECIVGVMDETDIELGERQIAQQLELLRLCLKTNYWPGYPQDEPVRLSMDSWHEGKVMREIKESDTLHAELLELDRRLSEVKSDEMQNILEAKGA